MAGGTYPLTFDDVAELLNDVLDKLNALEQDFKRHDHGNTASYVQGAITIRGSDNSFNGASKTSGQVTKSKLGRHPAGR